MAEVYLLLGSNLGEREKRLDQAIEEIAKWSTAPPVLSQRYETAPWGFEAEQHFLNQAIGLETEQPPLQLLDAILSLEEKLGRIRTENPTYSSRTIDIDILIFGNLVMNDSRLIVPHPRLTERQFALVPLAEIAGNLLHPVLQKSVNHLLADCPDNLKVEGPV